MDFYVIPPLQNLDLMNYGDRYFCLAQLYLKNKAYRDFFKERVARGCWVTLDNGAGDHDIVSREKVLEIARELQPSELIPLDILFNKDQTLENLDWTIHQMQDDPLLCNIQILACPQGETLDRWIECFEKMSSMDEVSTIGMSKLAIPFAITGVKFGDENIGRSRNLMYSILKLRGLLTKPMHFLGAGEVDEFEMYKKDPLCRSTDSCFSVWGGMNDQYFSSESYKRIPTPKDYFERSIDPKSLFCICQNIVYLRELLKK
ncbi:hypothetical protein Phi19:2_gp042 [Cellulophaga phage phi19:2]|uniref:Uncharacterized protein n=3 Tax=Cellulophaga phage phiST TaxID=756282 RepID=M4SLA5_9CAUD|nr:hypothetical protein CGPG_00065 [Cellulophaga phage phiST]AGH56763.1 hypothetical protein CGPG_00065 [Cellulophaga phage phiST]AGO47181.1 hypothetical protein PhiST_gp042 [Cellulophaga phage phiST]AGO48677.1 hypothetical protein Phi19:2_gp042 [Cellulophaga phage phi19:2]AGO49047.1 hypothetical protein Phi13:1_gp036 [Cellulophaga phage phi13:1]